MEVRRTPVLAIILASATTLPPQRAMGAEPAGAAA